MPTDHTDTDLTESERATLTNALHVAAERFDEHVRELSNALEKKPAYDGMAKQFAKQAAEARALAERLNDAEYIRLETPTA